MKNAKIKRLLLVAIGAGFVWWASKSPAQEAPANNVSPQMSDAVTQVLELEQAKIADATIIAYVKSSGTSYNLNAAQIIFLQQQGLSDAVITAMLTQPRMGISVAPLQPTTATPAPAPQPMAAASATSYPGATDPSVIAQPQTTYVQTAPAPYSYSYYPYPYSYSYSYYPYYAWYGWPRVGWPFGWAWYGGGWHWGWGWHGGSVAWHGTWGGGFHGGWGGGGHGGGWHR